MTDEAIYHFKRYNIRIYLHPGKERCFDFGCGQAPAAFSSVRALQIADTW